MRYERSFLVAGALGMAGALAGCGAKASSSPAAHGKPADVEAVAGADDLHVVSLTEDAARRVGVETAPVAEGGAVPYGAILYDPDGQAWVYVEQQPLRYVREAVTVEAIDGDVARLKEGPAAGSIVVRTGAVELYGSEFGVGH